MSVDLNFPLVRVSVEGVRQQMVHAFHGQCLEMDEQFKTAIDLALKPENVQAILNEAAAKFLHEQIEEEIRVFFARGDGRKLVATIVIDRLHREFPSTVPADTGTTTLPQVETTSP